MYGLRAILSHIFEELANCFFRNFGCSVKTPLDFLNPLLGTDCSKNIPTFNTPFFFSSLMLILVEEGLHRVERPGTRRGLEILHRNSAVFWKTKPTVQDSDDYRFPWGFRVSEKFLEIFSHLSLCWLLILHSLFYQVCYTHFLHT